MRLCESRYLDDGKDSNDGRPVSLIQLLLAAILYFLEPASLLELGCGKADVPFLLHLKGSCQVRGLELSPDILAAAPVEVPPFLETGGLLLLARKYAAQGRLFGLICGLDIWEHLHPARLGAAIAATEEISSPEALFFFILSAFGYDRIFGEVFFQEFEDNRANFEASQPSPLLVAERLNPRPLPQRLAGEALHRPLPHPLPVLERDIHRRLDHHLNCAARDFFVLCRNTPQAQAREHRLHHPLTPFLAWRQVHAIARSARLYEHSQGLNVLDPRRKYDWRMACWRPCWPASSHA
jgi:hypothetical protein